MTAESIGLGRRGALAGGLMALLLAACDGGARKPSVPLPRPRGPTPDPTPEATALCAAMDALGRPLMDSLVGPAPKATVMISPFSLAYGLYMLGQAARGPARAEIEALFGPKGQPQPLMGLAAPIANLNERMLDTADARSDYTNALWFDKTAGLIPTFAHKVSDLPEARVDALDLSTRADLNEINHFVLEATNGDMPLAMLDPAVGAKMIVVSTMFFQGAWNKLFAVADTKPAAFTRADGVVIQTPMMHAHGRFAYRETADFQAVALPYADPRYELVLILPRSGAVLANWTQGLDIDPAIADEGELVIPRLSLSWGGDVLPALAQLGLATALGPAADYGEASSLRVRPQQVFHRTLFVVDEQAPEADVVPPPRPPTAGASNDADDAAPPAAPAPPASAPSAASKPFDFRADRPFYLALRETGDGAPLFYAFVAEPGGSMGW